jgi:hypothetical protein
MLVLSEYRLIGFNGPTQGCKRKSKVAFGVSGRLRLQNF